MGDGLQRSRMGPWMGNILYFYWNNDSISEYICEMVLNSTLKWVPFY